jgi:hypothetical protein
MKIVTVLQNNASLITVHGNKVWFKNNRKNMNKIQAKKTIYLVVYF